jgi:triacylglycerol lipase
MNPVVLVHGFLDTTAVFTTMTDYLTRQGWEVHSFNLIPNHGYEKLEVLASQVGNYIEKNFAREQKVDLIGFSMGGLITRYYLQRLGGVERVQRYLNISAPNCGTLTAYSLPLAGIRQMQPGSQFLEDLNRDYQQLLEKIQTTIIWTPYDLMIFPAHSSRLSVGREITIPVLLHAWMLKDARVLTTIKDTLLESA